MLTLLTEKVLSKIPTAMTHVRLLTSAPGFVYLVDCGKEFDLRRRKMRTRFSGMQSDEIMPRTQAEEIARQLTRKGIM